MTIKLELSGEAALEKALGELKQATGKRVLRRVGKRALEPMRAKAEAMAPVADEPYTKGSFKKGTLRTVIPGGLKESIVISERRTRRVRKEMEPISGIQMAMGPSSGAGVLNYASFQEFGTVDHPPQSFMRAAYNGEAEGAISSILDDLWSEIEKSAKRAARKRAKG